MSYRQLSLFMKDPSLPSGSEIILERKPYIQPFERILAHAELRGLFGESGNGFLSSQAEERVILDGSQVNIELLKNRLAYWQRLIAKDIIIPKQIWLELSDDSSFDKRKLLRSEVSSTELPALRRLRYGPHDIHEYRGKFFPQLVRSLINAAGLREGSVVIDPTCGSGTTNCEARLLGMRTVGVDLNPLSVFISETKTAVLDLTSQDLEEEIGRILAHIGKSRQASNNLTKRWNKTDYSYLLRWFDPAALGEISQVLDLIEAIKDTSILALFKVALSNILRSVSWQKETDLRVRKEVTEYQPGTVFKRFSEEINRQGEKLTRYLPLLNEYRPFPKHHFYEGDARKIDTLLAEWAGKCDLLITSPPYATALPYIDTDRLSLVVLNLLPREEHRKREYGMIGNREVLESQREALWNNYQQRRSELPESVCTLIDEIAEVNHQEGVGFRRRNLPALLGKYFLDMFDAMVSARKLMRPDSLAYYVVGNNSTRVNGKKVIIPTDQFLWEIGKRAGWHQEKFLNMELLPSRDIFRKNRGSAESILVFRSTVKRSAIYGSQEEMSEESTDEGWDFHNVATQEHLHSIHPYPARFIPQIPRKAILENTQPGDVVLDPFCGGGTTLLESILLGRPAIGVDNNDVASLVSKAKVATYTSDDIEELQRFHNSLEAKMRMIASGVSVPEYKNRDYWFSEQALVELGRLKYLIEELREPARTLALTLFSAIVVRASYQDSDTRYAKVQKQYTAGSALTWFQQRLSSTITELKLLANLPRASAQVHHADAREMSFLASSSIDFIVTSPPYLNAYDYHKYHRHRLHWIGGDVSFARDKEIGKHDTFTRPNADPQEYFDNMRDCFLEWRRVLRPSGRALVVIGDAIVNKSAVPVADRFIEILGELDLELERRAIRNLQTSRKSFNQRARINQEHVLLFRAK